MPFDDFGGIPVDALLNILAPDLRGDAPSAWHELVPVAHWLVAALRPRVLVELGTHAGVSFSAFCSAIDRLGLPTKAFAVDTWKGDAHAGHYDENIYTELKAFVGQRFGGFAQLLRRSFDDARESFAAGSIDLLHIDGYHTYEAVSHDFRTWLPKLSACGVVALHDVNCRNEDFGVWKLWEEIRHEFPAFEFSHGNGLGLIAAGSAPPPELLRLAEDAEGPAAARLKAFFALAGRGHGALYELRVQSLEQLRAIREDRRLVDEDRHRIDGERLQMAARVAALTEERDALARADSVESDHTTLRERFKVQDAQIAALQEERWAAALQREAAVAEIARLGAERDAALQTVRAIERRLLLRRAWRGGLYVLHLIKLRLLGALAGKTPAPPQDVENDAAPQAAEGANAPDLPANVAAILSHADGSDLAHIDALDRRGVLPALSALVFSDGGPTCHLEAVLRSLHAQQPRCRQVFVVGKGPGQDLTLPAGLDVTYLADGLTLGDVTPVDALLVLASSATLRIAALAAFAVEIGGGADVVYSDEIYVGPDHANAELFLKPDHAPRLAASSHYIGSCGAIAINQRGTREAIDTACREVGEAGSVAAFLTRRCREAGNVRHLPFVLFEEWDAQRRCLPRPVSAQVPGSDRIVSIIIATRDRLDLLQPCIESIIAVTTYPRERFEIVIVDNGSEREETLSYLRANSEAGNFIVVRDPGDFNYPRLNNAGVRASRGEVLLFLNNDTRICQPAWLDLLVARACEPGIGCVGAKLLYEDGTVQHAGVVLGIQGVAQHIDIGAKPDTAGHHGLSYHSREISAVTGACLAVMRRNFDQAGGLDETLAVAFNDTLLCTTMLEMGLVNFQENAATVIHLESRSRGLDDTPERKQAFFDECRYVRERTPGQFLNDVYYNPNFDLHTIFRPTEVPRRRKPWLQPRFREAPSILLLSNTLQRGHGVPVVMAQQAAYFLKLGWSVHIGGCFGPIDLPFPDCVRVEMKDSQAAIRYAMRHNIDIVVPHTPPFFSISRMTGPFPIVAAFDHGEPPPALFPDQAERQRVNEEKAFSLMLSHAVCCISEPVRDACGVASAKVFLNGNSHMPSWGRDSLAKRQRTRRSYGWEAHTVVLSVSRFHQGERFYKGVDSFADVARLVRNVPGEDGVPPIVFVQCGKADDADIDHVAASGLVVVANATEAQLDDLYCAADAYASFSLWEGWNLGIAQAQAYGLPVIASDIPAHRRNFDINPVGGPDEAADLVIRLARDTAASGFAPERVPVIQAWEERLAPLAEALRARWVAA